jgi:L-Lysine epsilon oxidase N-terminal
LAKELGDIIFRCGLWGARTEYRIYPSIGIARIGDCKDSFLIGPEAPGVAPSVPFRGADRGLKPQAARFRIYKVDIDANENETVTEEVLAGDGIEIEWSVSLANRKAAGFRIDDTLARAANPRPTVGQPAPRSNRD